MIRIRFFPLAILALLQLTLGIALAPPSLAQEWLLRRPRGTLKVVDLTNAPSVSILENYAEPLVTLDKDNNWVPCLAKDLRWINDQTIEFKLREAVRFHNGEEFNAEMVRKNWEEYKKMKSPLPFRFVNFADDTIFEVIDEYTVRFTFPEPEGLAFAKFRWFNQFAPAFFGLSRRPHTP